MKDGRYVEYYENGNLKKSYTIKDCQFSGLCIHFREDGTKQRECYYITNRFALLTVYDMTGKIFYKTIMKDGDHEYYVIYYLNNVSGDLRVRQIDNLFNNNGVRDLFYPSERWSENIRKCIYIGEKIHDKYHYSNGKIRKISCNDSSRKYYKNGYDKSLYKKKIIFFY